MGCVSLVRCLTPVISLSRLFSASPGLPPRKRESWLSEPPSTPPGGARASSPSDSFIDAVAIVTGADPDSIWPVVASEPLPAVGRCTDASPPLLLRRQKQKLSAWELTRLASLWTAAGRIASASANDPLGCAADYQVQGAPQQGEGDPCPEIELVPEIGERVYEGRRCVYERRVCE